MAFKAYSAADEEMISLVGKSTGMPEVTSGGFAPQAAGVGGPTMIFWQKATRGPSLANLHGALHEAHALHPY